MPASALRRLAAACLLLGSLGASSARAQLLVNGNFESGPAIPPIEAMLALGAGSTVVPGWTVSTGTVVVITDVYWVPLSGTRSVNLSDNRPSSASTVPGGIQQTFATSPGSTYRLTFWVTGEPFSAPTLKHLRVNAGPVQQDYTYDNSLAWHWDMDWAQHTLDFTANAATSTLRFTSLDVSKWGPAIDSAKVELVSAGVSGGAALALAPVSPDPVRTSGRLSFTLPVAQHARLTIVDVQGREVARLADGEFAPGARSFEFSPQASGASPGLYFAVLRTGERMLVRRFSVLQ
ncbi:MAG: choice-of-anchor C family protein [Candidatus Eisenbacteria bacterium]